MRKILTVGIFLTTLCLIIPSQGETVKVITDYTYGEYGRVATGATTKVKETGRVLWTATLKEIRAEEKVIVLEERTHRYTETKDYKREDIYISEVTRDTTFGRIVSETMLCASPKAGNYKTVYKYGEHAQIDIPDEAITEYAGEEKVDFICISKLIKVVPKEENQSWLEIEETHYRNGKIIFQSLVKRDMRSGDIFDENIIKGRRTVVYQTWSLNRWPCGA